MQCYISNKNVNTNDQFEGNKLGNVLTCLTSHASSNEAACGEWGFRI